jgi:DNA-binding transcriptional MerR regulator
VLIGELARRTGVPARRLRYYEEQGLLSSGRSPNGYRDYDPQAVQRVTQIRGLIDAGIPTAIIKDILPLLDNPRTIHVTGPATKLIDGSRAGEDSRAGRSLLCRASDRW